ncbi:hypothetical protein VPNG_04365 [Cytospora leucostoma]|uniref:Uncharacterized protein n=1 Tax=Cytospora leucostoma TaxID=1230097 RepID=A0A423XBQ5_9PEZI|nr:hypothetical protein VPNG_04365 [Cytospora leucostoma]
MAVNGQQGGFSVAYSRTSADPLFKVPLKPILPPLILPLQRLAKADTEVANVRHKWRLWAMADRVDVQR